MSSSRSPEAIHRTVWDLIPWVVNGRASTRERSLVDRHARVCEACGEELEIQRRLHFAMALESGKTRDPVAGFRELRNRIEEADGAERSITADIDSPIPRSPHRSVVVRALVAAVIVEAIGLVAVGSALFSSGDIGSRSPSYRTLAAASPSSSRIATIRVVWAPAATLEQMQSTLRRLGLEVVSGPTEAGVYSLAPLASNGDAAWQLAQLRADANVRFAEPLPPSSTGSSK